MADKYRELDRVFSHYIRYIDTYTKYPISDDEIIGCNRVGVCCTCRRKVNYIIGHCGHYIGRDYLSTRFEETNCALQCPECNMLYYGRPKEFKKFIITKYGEQELERLKKLKHTTLKLSKSDIDEKIRYYREKIKAYDTCRSN
jgi:hypothetical protein